MKINSINMKRIIDDETYYRMWVDAMELPEWMHLKAKEMDEDCGYITSREKQRYEIEGYISNINNSVNELNLVYYFDDYETIVVFDENIHKNVFVAFKEFVDKYGDKMPDNEELCLGDCEYEDLIPQELKDIWN